MKNIIFDASLYKDLLFNFVRVIFKFIGMVLIVVVLFVISVEILIQIMVFMANYVGVMPESPVTVLIIWGVTSIFFTALLVIFLHKIISLVWRKIFKKKDDING